MPYEENKHGIIMQNNDEDLPDGCRGVMRKAGMLEE